MDNPRRYDLPMKTRAQLQAMLAALDQRIPDMLHEAGGDQDEFWCIFAGEADELVEQAGEADCDWVHEQMRTLLGAHGVAWQSDAGD